MAVDRRGDGGGGGPAEAGLAHLRAAAREAIEAGRALLDAAESALDDPDLGRQLADSLRAVSEMAATLRPDPRRWPTSGRDAASAGAAPAGDPGDEAGTADAGTGDDARPDDGAAGGRSRSRSGRARRPAPRVTRIEVG